MNIKNLFYLNYLADELINKGFSMEEIREALNVSRETKKTSETKETKIKEKKKEEKTAGKKVKNKEDLQVLEKLSDIGGDFKEARKRLEDLFEKGGDEELAF